MRLYVVAALALAAQQLACGPAVGLPPAAPVVGPQIVATDDDPGGTSAEVFERGRLSMSVQQHAHARVLFDRVRVAERAAHPEAWSGLAVAASYNAALCSETLEETADARDRFRALAEAAPKSPDAVDAQLRRGRLDVELEAWPDLGVAAAALLAAPDLARPDRAEAHALRALHTLHGQHDLVATEKAMVQAQKLLEVPPVDVDAVAPPQNVAAVQFARGDLLRAQGDAIAFLDGDDPKAPIVSADFPAKLEARCQKILDAQDAYVEAINTRQLRWAVRAGLRVATMYLDLHRDVLRIPPPKSAATDAKKALFRGAMMLRYRILLEKGLGTLERTLNLETKAGAKSTWLEHARSARAAVEKQLAEEKAALAKLPYSEEELKKALDLLAKKPPKS